MTSVQPRIMRSTSLLEQSSLSSASTGAEDATKPTYANKNNVLRMAPPSARHGVHVYHGTRIAGIPLRPPSARVRDGRRSIQDVAGGDDVAVVVLAGEDDNGALAERSGQLADHLAAVRGDKIDVAGLTGVLNHGLYLHPFGVMRLAVVENVDGELGCRHDELGLMAFLAGQQAAVGTGPLRQHRLSRGQHQGWEKQEGEGKLAQHEHAPLRGPMGSQ